MQKILIASNEYVGAAIDQFSIANASLENAESQIKILNKQKDAILEQYSFAQKKEQNLYEFCSIAIPILSIGTIAAGGYCIYKDYENIGKPLIIGGAASLLTVEVILQGGKFIFRVF